MMIVKTAELERYSCNNSSTSSTPAHRPFIHSRSSLDTITYSVLFSQFFTFFLLRNHLEDSLGHVLHGLPDTKITKDLLGTTKDGIKLVAAVEVLDDAAHAGLGQATATPDLDGLVGDLVRGARAGHLEQGDGTAEVLGLLGVGHVVHLVAGDGC